MAISWQQWRWHQRTTHTSLLTNAGKAAAATATACSEQAGDDRRQATLTCRGQTRRGSAVWRRACGSIAHAARVGGIAWRVWCSPFLSAEERKSETLWRQSVFSEAASPQISTAPAFLHIAGGGGV